MGTVTAGMMREKQECRNPEQEPLTESARQGCLLEGVTLILVLWVEMHESNISNSENDHFISVRRGLYIL